MRKVNTTRRRLNTRGLVHILGQLTFSGLRNLLYNHTARHVQVLTRNNRIRDINMQQVIRTSGQVIAQHIITMAFRARRRQGHRRVRLTTSHIQRLIRHGRHNRHQINRNLTAQRESSTPLRIVKNPRHLTNTSRTLSSHVSKKVGKVSHVKTRMRSVLIPRVSRVLNNNRRTILVISKSNNIRTILHQHVSTSSQRISTFRLLSFLQVRTRQHCRCNIRITTSQRVHRRITTIFNNISILRRQCIVPNVVRSKFSSDRRFHVRPTDSLFVRRRHRAMQLTKFRQHNKA